jgi:hypothetical protein
MSMPEMPYSLTTATGDRLEFSFPLHQETGSAVRVAQLLTSLLATLDREIKLLGETANGDVLQALAMTLAARVSMIHAPYAPVARLALSLTESALTAAARVERIEPPAGRA